MASLASQALLEDAWKVEEATKCKLTMKIPINLRNRYRYYDFHEDVGHYTFECYSLHNQIEGLVRGDY